MSNRQTDRQTHRPRYTNSSTPHLCTLSMQWYLAHTHTRARARVHTHTQTHTHTHTHTHPLMAFSGLPRSAGTRKVKPIWILLKQETVSGSDISWAICKSAPCSRQTTIPTPHHSFLQAGCPSCRPTNSVKALKAYMHNQQYIKRYRTDVNYYCCKQRLPCAAWVGAVQVRGRGQSSHVTRDWQPRQRVHWTRCPLHTSSATNCDERPPDAPSSSQWHAVKESTPYTYSQHS